ncbi:hypothetical protein AKJ16_DCAP14399 [Drosera capensis]
MIFGLAFLICAPLSGMWAAVGNVCCSLLTQVPKGKESDLVTHSLPRKEKAECSNEKNSLLS